MKGDYIPPPEYVFKFANCDRSIEFMLDFGTKADHRNNLYKIDKMVSVLQEFRKGVELEGERWLEFKRRNEE